MFRFGNWNRLCILKQQFIFDYTHASFGKTTIVGIELNIHVYYYYYHCYYFRKQRIKTIFVYKQINHTSDNRKLKRMSSEKYMNHIMEYGMTNKNSLGLYRKQLASQQHQMLTIERQNFLSLIKIILYSE